MDNWKALLKQIHPIYIISFLYFFISLINLTLLPIFNDEAIYLDWGWANTHIPGHLYDSLFDAKPPLMIWLFGWIGFLFPDPLWGGRFISILFGFGSLLGIYTLARKMSNDRTAIIAGLFYMLSPIFFFYNRQALMESGVMCAGIWSGVMLWELLHKYSHSKSILLGLILGLGFFMKASMLLFIISAAIILFSQFLITRKFQYLLSMLIASAVFYFTDILLFINPLFWGYFMTNSRYSFTISELLQFPVSTWMSSWRGFFEIGFFFVTPVIFLTGLWGIYLFIRRKNKAYILITAFFLLALLAEIFTIKSQIQRYLVSYLPFLVIPAAYVLTSFKHEIFKKSIVLVAFIPSLFMLGLLLFSPRDYFLQLAKVSSYSEMPYASGQTSGYGVAEAVAYIKQQANPYIPGLVLYGLQPGNPENAVDVYIEKTPNLMGMHMNASLFSGLDHIDCMASDYPVFVLTRMDQKLGMDKYLVLEKTFPNPDPKYWISIYTLKKDCQGNTGSLTNAYAETIKLMQQLKSGSL